MRWNPSPEDEPFHYSLAVNKSMWLVKRKHKEDSVMLYHFLDYFGFRGSLTSFIDYESSNYLSFFSQKETAIPCLAILTLSV